MCRAVLRDSVDGPVQEDRLVRLAYLGRESTFRGLKILGTPAAGSHNIPWGGEPGGRASRRRFLHNTTRNSMSANYETSSLMSMRAPAQRAGPRYGLEALERLIFRLVRG
jgi:hypothetical protein